MPAPAPRPVPPSTNNPLFKAPLLATVASCLAATAVGAAQGALDDYLAATSRRITRGAVAGAGVSGYQSWRYISTSRPTSTTWAAGTPKYAAGRLALRCIVANRDFRQATMPGAVPGITMTRLK